MAAKKAINDYKGIMMNLKDGITKAYETHWSMINTFSVQIHFRNNKMLELIKESFDDDININIIEVVTPDYQNSPIETFIGNRWRIQNGRDELYKFSIKFRDMNQMNLYKSFYNIYRYTKEQYFDNCCFDVKIFKDPDYANETDYEFMSLNESIVESLSQLQFSNETQNQIAEFTVNFKCVSPNVY